MYFCIRKRKKGMKLSDLKIGQTAKIETVGGEGALRQHFLDMGVIPGAEVTLDKYAPLGDPMQLTVQGYTLTLRKDDAKKIEVTPSQSPQMGGEICPPWEGRGRVGWLGESVSPPRTR